ncbi:hypothetical protein [Clostridium pasteurianum]|uniref:hypothetical protein n=1 Tax=Clostridium pasteurianum TaxID=1501 RepID=UPI001A9A3D41|nr:hypothetical protein [Clostridium pasteurianum]
MKAVSEILKKFVSRSSRNFKGFLYRIAYDKTKIISTILKLKVPASKQKILFRYGGTIK